MISIPKITLSQLCVHSLCLFTRIWSRPSQHEYWQGAKNHPLPAGSHYTSSYIYPSKYLKNIWKPIWLSKFLSVGRTHPQFKGCCVVFFHLYRTSWKHTVEALIRRCSLSWECTVCLCSAKKVVRLIWDNQSLFYKGKLFSVRNRIASVLRLCVSFLVCQLFHQGRWAFASRLSILWLLSYWLNAI